VNRAGEVGKRTNLRARRTTFRISLGARVSPVVQNVQTGCGSHPGSYLLDAVEFFPP